MFGRALRLAAGQPGLPLLGSRRGLAAAVAGTHQEGLGERVRHVAEEVKHAAEEIVHKAEHAVHKVQDVIHERREQAREEAERGMFTADDIQEVADQMMHAREHTHKPPLWTHSASTGGTSASAAAAASSGSGCSGGAPAQQGPGVMRAEGRQGAGERGSGLEVPADEEQLLEQASSDLADPARQQELAEALHPDSPSERPGAGQARGRAASRQAPRREYHPDAEDELLEDASSDLGQPYRQKELESLRRAVKEDKGEA